MLLKAGLTFAGSHKKKTILLLALVVLVGAGGNGAGLILREQLQQQTLAQQERREALKVGRARLNSAEFRFLEELVTGAGDRQSIKDELTRVMEQEGIHLLRMEETADGAIKVDGAGDLRRYLQLAGLMAASRPLWQLQAQRLTADKSLVRFTFTAAPILSRDPRKE